MQAKSLLLSEEEQATAIKAADRPLGGRLSDYAQFSKFRLSALVIVSAAAGYLIAVAGNPDWVKFSWLIIGGFLVTAGSNGFNQVMERDTDSRMRRTSGRPLPTGRMSMIEGLLVASLMGSLGVFILLYFINPLCGILSAASLLSYTLVYTPFKKLSPFAVFVGAFPGAVPPLLGWVAATGEISYYAWLLFFIQFIWQFPHFWAIAWVMDEDYKRAGFRMLPSNGEKNKGSAFQTLAYSIALVPLGMLPFAFRMCGPVATGVIVLAGILFSMQALKLYRSLDDADARKLMFGSFLYLPVVQFAMVIDRMVS